MILSNQKEQPAEKKQMVCNVSDPSQIFAQKLHMEMAKI